jgi:hypothetical protein
MRPNGEETKEWGDGIWEMEFFGKRQRRAEDGRYTGKHFYLNSMFHDQSLQSYAVGGLVNWLEMSEGAGFFQKSILCLGMIGYFVCAYEKLNIDVGTTTPVAAALWRFIPSQYIV